MSAAVTQLHAEPVARRRRKAAATLAPETTYQAHVPAQPIDRLSPHERAIVEAALAILGANLRTAGPACDTSRLAKEFVRLQLAGLGYECFAVLFLDAHSRLIAFEPMFRGTLTQTSVYPREIAHAALRHGAAAVILAHNHPSGAAEPSRADEHLTCTLKMTLGVFDVRVLDHLVVGGADVVSFAERGLL